MKPIGGRPLGVLWGGSAAPFWLLSAALALGCAAVRGPSPSAEAAADSAQAIEAEWPDCKRVATVTVLVDNQSSMDMGISFGAYRPGRFAPGLSRTTYEVPRYYLESSIQLQIVGGGLALSAPPPVRTEPVVCNDATLIIGPRPRYSFFYGDVVSEPTPEDSGS